MKKGLAGFLCVLIIFVWSGSFAGEQRPIVAVFQIQDKDAGLSEKTLKKLTQYLGTKISEGRAFRLVPPGDVRRALIQKKKETYKECYDEKCQIELGHELAANKSLSTSILKIGKKCVVTSHLYDLKTQASEISASAEGLCSEYGLMKSIKSVAGEIRASASGRIAFKEEDLGEKPPGDWEVGGGEEVIVRFESDPQGAVVLVDGSILCRETPCSKSLKKGRHLVAMKSERHLEKKERLVVSEGTEVTWKLTPNFGWLSVRSEPSGLPVKINGRESGETPINREEREPGVYKVLVTSDCHYNSGKKVKVKRGQEQNVSVRLKEKQGAVRVKANDYKGNDLVAAVYVDGRKVGRTPGTFKVYVCAKELEVRHKKHGTAKKAISISVRKVTSLEFKLQGGGGVEGVEWVNSKPAGIGFTKSEITVAQYRGCVEAGKCTEPKSKSESKYCNWGYADRDNHPINCVDWHQATAFCSWAGGRLPTEEEWYAEASNGGKRKYPWGNSVVTCDYAVMDQGGGGCGRDSTWPVCSKPAGDSVSGLCDMSGNVWEWTSSSEGSARFIRGGSWIYSNPKRLRASRRGGNVPSLRSNGLGFRCGRAAP